MNSDNKFGLKTRKIIGIIGFVVCLISFVIALIKSNYITSVLFLLAAIFCLNFAMGKKKQ